jgi:hypothetical protein
MKTYTLKEAQAKIAEASINNMNWFIGDEGETLISTGVFTWSNGTFHDISEDTFIKMNTDNYCGAV